MNVRIDLEAMEVKGQLADGVTYDYWTFTGRYILVDHALSRMQRGLAGYLIVDGPAAPEIFNGTPMPGSGH